MDPGKQNTIKINSKQIEANESEFRYALNIPKAYSKGIQGM
jgi:hypothetical protein